MATKKEITIKIATPIKSISVNPKQKMVYMGWIVDANNVTHLFTDDGRYIRSEIGKKYTTKK